MSSNGLTISGLVDHTLVGTSTGDKFQRNGTLGNHP